MAKKKRIHNINFDRLFEICNNDLSSRFIALTLNSNARLTKIGLNGEINHYYKAVRKIYSVTAQPIDNYTKRVNKRRIKEGLNPNFTPNYQNPAKTERLRCSKYLETKIVNNQQRYYLRIEVFSDFFNVHYETDTGLILDFETEVKPFLPKTYECKNQELKNPVIMLRPLLSSIIEIKTNRKHYKIR